MKRFRVWLLVPIGVTILCFSPGCGKDSPPTKPGDGNHNGNDTTPPEVILASPANGASVSGVVHMTATASDASGIASVTFALRDLCGQVIESWTDIAAPYEADWDCAAALGGRYTICVSAKDRADNESGLKCVEVAKGTTGVTVDGFVPPGQHIGGSITAYGANFGPDDGRGYVLVYDVAATVSSWSDTAITFVIPPGPWQDGTVGMRVIVDCRMVAEGSLDVTPPGVTRLTDDAANDGEPCWSMDGNFIYFSSSRTGNYDIYRVPAVGGVETSIISDPDADDWPDVNPSDALLVWGSTRDVMGHNPTHDYEIFYGDASMISQITFNELLDRTPAWSPTNYMGYSIAYSTYIDSLEYMLLPRVFLYSNTEGHVWFAEGENPNWSPNGREIVYQKDDNIYTRAIGGPPVQLTATSHDCLPHWGWSNNKIVFQRYGGYTGHDIYVMNADGTDQHALVAGGYDELSPSWSIDGTRVVYASRRWNNLDIYVYKLPF